MACRIVVQKVNSILLFFGIFYNPIQLQTIEISSDDAVIRKNFLINNYFDSSPHTRHDILRM